MKDTLWRGLEASHSRPIVAARPTKALVPRLVILFFFECLTTNNVKIKWQYKGGADLFTGSGLKANFKRQPQPQPHLQSREKPQTSGGQTKQKAATTPRSRNLFYQAGRGGEGNTRV